jgi:hypothetical protein
LFLSNLSITNIPIVVIMKCFVFLNFLALAAIECRGFRGRRTGQHSLNLVRERLPFAVDQREVRESKDSIDSAKDTFRGPLGEYKDMIAGVQNAQLGLDILVGPSTIAGAGYGVFAALSDEVQSVEVKEGQPLMGYSKGTFTSDADKGGDKTVAWNFHAVDQAIFFEKELMTIKDALGIVSNRHDAAEMTDLLLGHKLYYDEEEKEVAVRADEEFNRRYFVPHEVEATLAESVDPTAESAGCSAEDIYHGIDVSNMGSYVNDLAYERGVSMEAYTTKSATANQCAIVWRIEDKGGVLCPTWPVVVAKSDMVFDNTEAMELGLEYNWRYWHAFEENAAVGRGGDVE